MILESTLLLALFQQCSAEVSPVTLNAIVKTESGGNPYAVANVTDKKSLFFDDEISAVKYTDQLQKEGKNYSVGLMQINSNNFKAYNLTNQTAFNYCNNIKTGGDILAQCYVSAKTDNNNEQERLQKAFSCYYSGNFTTGFKKIGESKSSYIDKVIENKTEIYKVPTITKGIEQKQQEKDNSKKVAQDWDIFNDYSR